MTQASVLRASVLLASMASLALVLVHARLFSALVGAETAPWAPGFALAGVAVGACLAGLLSSRLAPPRALGAFGVLVGASSLAAIAATIAVMKLAPPVDGELASPLRLGIVGLLAATPSGLVGAAHVGVLAHARSAAPQIATFGLAGAAVGVPLAVALVRGVGAPRAALLLAVLLAATGVVAALGGRLAAGRGRSGNPAVAWGFLLGAAAVVGGELGAPFLRLTHTQGARPDRAEMVRWSELGLVTADIPSRGGAAQLHVDGVSVTGVIAAASEPPKGPEQMGYVLPGDRAPVLIVGAGGGRDVRAALASGHRDVYAAEVERVIVDEVGHGRLREHAGDVYARPEVKLVVTDPRGYAARNPESFRTIVMASPASGAAGPAATLVRSDAGLTTVEGVGALLGALAPGGALVVARPDDDAPRLVALISAALRARGVAAPRGHLFGCSHQKSTGVLVSREPLAEGAIQAVRAWCKRGKYREVLAPDRTTRPEIAALADDPSAPLAEGSRDLAPPTDDRPFFGHDVRPDRLLAAIGARAAWREHPLLRSALVLLAVGIAVTLIAGVLARVAGRVPPSRAGAPRGLAFLALVAAGHALAHGALVQRLAVFVAHPTHALLVVVTAALVGAALGASSARAIAAVALVRAVLRRSEALALALAVLAVGLGPVLAHLGHLGQAAGVLVAAVLPFALGALAGGLVPLGIRAVASWSVRRAALAIAVAAGAAVVGCGVAALLTVHTGAAYVLLLAAALHLAACLAIPRPAHARA